MDYTEKLLRTVAEKTIGTAVIQYQGHTIDLTKPFDRLTAKEAVLKYAPQYTAEQLEDKDFMQEELKRLGTSLTTRLRFLRWPVPLTKFPASQNASNSSWPAAKPPTASPS